MYRNRAVALVAAALLAGACADAVTTPQGPASRPSLTSTKYVNQVAYKGQGLLADGFGGYDLQTEICGIANGADVDGPYLLWVLTATGAANAEIEVLGSKFEMTKTGNGTFKYVSGWYDPDALKAAGAVSASYNGAAKNAQLVISHGCRPFTNGAWCSPGFWKNAAAAAWTLTGYAKTDLFNSTVVPNFYDTASAAAPTLITVLTTPGANTFGAASGPYGLNAFNATGAFLTDNIPGYDFDNALFVQAQTTGETDTMCPIDHFGNFKTPTP
jgi:hypothetical protein